MRTLYIIGILLIFFSCQNNQKQNNAWEKLIDPKDTIREYFDVAFFDSITKNITESIYQDNGKIIVGKKSYQHYTKEWEFIQKLRTQNGFQERREHSDSTYELIYHYYKNGNIKSKSKLYPEEGFRISKTYEYDSIGNLINVIDNDGPYIYSIDSILLYIKNNNISIRSIGRGEFKGRNNGKPTWILEWIKYNRKVPDTDSLYYLYLDGATGHKIDDEIHHYEDM